MSEGQGTGTGWQPLSKPDQGRRRGRAPAAGRLNVDGSPIVSSFVRLARTHAYHAAGDATYAVALVGSIFALDTDAARGRILLYLLLTLAPFALVGPFIGPALDRMRGGRRMMIVITLVARALMMLMLIRNIDTLWLFPLAFTQLVLAKTYSVAKAATVPTTVATEEELVDKNARLAVLGTVAGGVGAAPALGLQAIWGSSATLGYAFIIYCLGVYASIRLPSVFVDDPGASDDDEVEIRSAGVRLAASAMAVLRGITGFVFWLMVFAYGSNDIDLDGIGTAAGASVRYALGFSIEGDNSQPAWKLGFVLAAIGAGIFLGNVLAPRLRERLTEERMIVGALGAVFAASAGVVWAGGLSGAFLLALIVGIAPASAKLAFDSLVQRDAPGANHGAAFGRFETRFQIASVIGSVFAVAPTVVIPVRVGGFVVALASLVAGVTYLLGARGVRIGPAIARFRAQRDAGRNGAGFGGHGGDGHVEVEGRDRGVTEDQAGSGPGLPTEPAGAPSASPTLYDAATEPTAVFDRITPAVPYDAATEPTAVVDRVPPGPYAEGFAEEPVEPADWSEVGLDPSDGDPMLPPRWLDDD